LEPYYAYTAEQVPRAGSFYEKLLQQVRGLKLTLVHGDFSPKNILVYEDRLILIDHEVIHFGDPAFDLGFSLTHLLSKAHHVEGAREKFLQAALSHWRDYWRRVATEEWAKGMEARTVCHTLGCLLARVAGRSPLEYFSDAERVRQKDMVVSMLEDPPKEVSELIRQFTAGL
jgi:thiamine kinase-like enzyme